MSDAIESGPAYYEQCACGATLAVNNMMSGTFADWWRHVDEWRSTHRHEMAPAPAEPRSMGFTTRAVSDMAFDGEDDED